MTKIALNRFCQNFGRRRVFAEVDAVLSWSDAERGEIIGLMGPSGSGKTTLLGQVMEARYGARPAGLTLTPGDTVIGFVPQAPVLFSHMDVNSNARLFERVGRYRARFDDRLFNKLATTLRLKQVLRQSNPETLSGGEMQRIMLLRTLSVKPDLLLLDEPANGLDPSVRGEFLTDLASVLAELGACALYVGHHWDEISFVARRIAYAVTSADDIEVAPIVALPVVDAKSFKEAPPTPGAFETVHGPGCEIWPVVETAGEFVPSLLSSRSHLLALRAPDSETRAFELRQHGPYRVSMRARRSAPAAIYKDGRFLTHSLVHGNPRHVFDK